MTDLEKVKRCAERVGVVTMERGGRLFLEPQMEVLAGRARVGTYWPLTNKAQAFDLVERFHMDIDGPKWHEEGAWAATAYGERADRDTPISIASATNLCRAIVECVAQMPCCPVSVNSPDSMTAK